MVELTTFVQEPLRASQEWTDVRALAERLLTVLNEPAMFALASLLGSITVPNGRFSSPSRWRTVRQAIGKLPRVRAGFTHPDDPLHTAALLSPRNLQRVSSADLESLLRRWDVKSTGSKADRIQRAIEYVAGLPVEDTSLAAGADIER